MYGVTERYSENIAKNVTFTGISGTVTMTDGTDFEISDRNIREGSLSINSKINSDGEFRAGGVCADELSMSLLNYGDSVQSLDGAEIVLEFRLYTDSSFTEYDSIPLGIFIVDGSTIRRQMDTVTFKAYDRLVLFDRSTWEMTDTLYNLISAACAACGVAFGMTQAEFEALPNGGLTVPVITSRVQTQRDLLMYAGILTNSFAKISRTGELLFIQLTCTQDEKGMVVPVREIQGKIRFSTEFSDSTARVTAFIMNRGGVRLTSRKKITSFGSDCLTLEWAENPLLSGMTDNEVRDVLTKAVSEIYHCINRAYKAEFGGDPALDIGDYVRLRGGEIDTKRGYGTGMITSQTWRYRGKHTIQCSMPTTVAVSAAATTVLSDDEGNVDRVQPKSQVQKELDELRANAGNAYRINSPDRNSYAEMLNTGELMIFKGGTPLMYLLNSGGMIGFQEAGSRYLHFDEHGGISLNNGKAGVCYLDMGTAENRAVRIETDGVDGAYPRSIFQLEYGAKLFANADGLLIGDKLRIVMTPDGFKLKRTDITCTLEAMSDGLYYNGVKIGG